jgi:hypothetical protein
MAIDFELTDAQKKLRHTAREFARDRLEPRRPAGGERVASRR